MTSTTTTTTTRQLDEKKRKRGAAAASSPPAAAPPSAAAPPPAAASGTEKAEEVVGPLGLLMEGRYLPMLRGHRDLFSGGSAAAATNDDDVFVKLAPMLDPQYLLCGHYESAARCERPAQRYTSIVSRHQKIMDPMNTAAVDALGAHLSGELHRRGVVPNALASFGYRVGIAPRFEYDVGHCADTCEEWLPSLFSWIKKPDNFDARLADMKAADARRADKRAAAKATRAASAADDEDEDDEDDEDDDEEEEDMFYEPGEAVVLLSRVPVVRIALERCRGGSLGELLVRQSMDAAQIESLALQLLFTLAAFQDAYQMVQGDLHVNNIMVQHTAETHLRYSWAGVEYAVPTFGRVYKIIDFGRAAFVVDGRRFVSDTFMQYSDGSGMYNCDANLDRRWPVVEPSMSMDLGLISGQLYDLLVNTTPEEEDDEDDNGDDDDDDDDSFVDDDANGSDSDDDFRVDFSLLPPVVRAIWSWGIMTHDPRRAAAHAAHAPHVSFDADVDYPADADPDAAKYAAFMDSISVLPPELAGKHSMFLDDGVTLRCGNLESFDLNQYVARHVHHAVPARLLDQYLRPDSRSWAF